MGYYRDQFSYFLYILFINNLPGYISSLNYRLYADEVIVVVIDTYLNVLGAKVENALTILERRFNTNKVKFNIETTNVIQLLIFVFKMRFYIDSSRYKRQF